MDQETVHRRRWYILGVLVVCLLVVILDNTILNVALKTIQEDLDASQSQMEWAINAYILVFAGLLFTWGILGDRYGRRRILMLGLALFGAASALSAFSQSPTQLILTRGLMGIGAAAVQPQTLSIITNVFEPAERGKAIGVWAGFSGLAIAIGPVTGGFLLEHFWWGSVFLVNVPFVVIGLLLIGLTVPESRDPAPGRVDPIGVVLSVVGLVTLVYGIIKGGQTNAWTSGEVAGPIVAGLVILALFVVVERRSTHPSLDVSLFRQRQFTAATVAISLTFFAMMGATFFLSFYLQALRGYQPLHAGLLLAPTAVALMLAAPSSSRLVKRFGTKTVCSIGLLLVAIAIGGYSLVDANTSIWAIEGLSFVLGLGMGNTMAPATNAVMSAVSREKAGAGSAVNNTARQVSGALGVAILGSVLSTVYRGQVGPSLKPLPANLTGDAAESIGNTLSAVGKAADAASKGALPPEVLQSLPGVQAAAKASFTHAMHVTSLWCAGIVLLGSLTVVLFLPGKKRKAAESEATAQQTAEPAGIMG